MSLLERVIRVSAGLLMIIIGLYYFNGVNGDIIGVTICMFGLLPLTTGLISYCPLYSTGGLKSKKTSR